MKYQVITIGGATRDIAFITKEGILIDNHRDVLRQKLLAFEYGAKIKIDRFYHLFGGGAANTAVNFATSGFKTACLVTVGKDENGKAIISNLSQHGISTSLISLVKDLESTISFILVAPTGERIIFTNHSTSNYLNITQKEEKILNQAKWLYITSLAENWLPIMRKIFSLTGPNIAWNPGILQYRAGLKKISSFLKRTNVFCVNKDEAIELVLSIPAHKKKSLTFFNDVKNLLIILKTFGPKIVLITSGQDGADVYDGKNFYHQEVLPEKKKVDVTGVGDVFNSSFVAGLEISSYNIKRALYLAAKNAASKIAHFGAQNGLLDLRKIK